MIREFLDTNILVYAFSDDPRADTAAALLARGHDTGVQVLNEFANVARRKLRMEWSEIGQGLAEIRLLCRMVHPLDVAVHEHAVTLAADHGFSFYDALIVAAALALSGAIGISRLVLGVHWPSDVIAGWALGTIVATSVTLASALGARALPTDPTVSRHERSRMLVKLRALAPKPFSADDEVERLPLRGLTARPTLSRWGRARRRG